ncbi:hypothetical protein EON09_26065, partial [Pseudomonas soli]|nr:hypothetical protein [Pseudomonas soli]
PLPLPLPLPLPIRSLAPYPASDSCVSPGAARNFATSGGRTEGLRREVTGMDARQAPIRPWMARRRVLPERARSEGTPERSVGAG